MSKSLEHNRSLKMMKSIEKVVKWRDVEALLLEHYDVGTSKEGAEEMAMDAWVVKPASSQ